MSRLRRADAAVIALVGTALIVMLVLGSIKLNSLPFLHPETGYSADLATTGGLHSGDQVRSAGMTVGSVKSVALDGDHVRVRFTVKRGLRLGNSTGVHVELATLLGQVFLAVDPSGPGQLNPSVPIPLAHTSVPYTLVNTFDQLGSTASNIDLPQLRKALGQLTATVHGVSAADVDSLFRGVTGMAKAVQSRQDEISGLIADAQQIVSTLNSRGSAIVAMLANGDAFLRALVQRRDAVHQLLVDTTNLGAQISLLIRDNGAHLSSLLANLDTVAGVLAKNEKQLADAVKMIGAFSVNVANATGSGPWLDALLPVAMVDSVVAGCGTNPTPGCGR